MLKSRLSHELWNSATQDDTKYDITPQKINENSFENMNEIGKIYEKFMHCWTGIKNIYISVLKNIIPCIINAWITWEPIWLQQFA